jgi:hypothetical protein
MMMMMITIVTLIFVYGFQLTRNDFKCEFAVQVSYRHRCRLWS